MSIFFLDSSAVVKRYFVEAGSGLIHDITGAGAGNALVVNQLTRVEAAAAFAAKHRASGGVTRDERDRAPSLLQRDFAARYRVAPVHSDVVSLAVDLTQAHRLRGYDAIQLASALVVNQEYLAAGLPPLTFVAADADLLAAAEAEGLAVEDPADHA